MNEPAAGAPPASGRVCIVGSGPAGMVLALELAERGCSVTLVESGTHRWNRKAQRLADAVLEDTATHALMSDAVQRRWGGTSHLWGGRCVPYDAADLEAPDGAGKSPWPLSYADLSINLEKACRYADCGPPEFSLNDIVPGQAFKPISEGFVDGDVRSDQLERWSADPVLVRKLGRRIKGDPRIQVLTGWTCIGVDVEDGGSAATGIMVVRTADGLQAKATSIAADIFVIACGGVESTRLLLTFGRGQEALKIDGRAFLGLGYMGHLFGKIASIRLLGDPSRTVFAFERIKNHYVRRRLTLTDRVRRTKQLLNICFTLDYPSLSDPSHRSGVLSAAYLAMRLPVLNSLLAPAATRKALLRDSDRGKNLQHIRNIASSIPATGKFIARFLHARYWAAAPKLPGFTLHSPTNVYALYYHAEQSAHDESRIELADTVDELGMPRAKVSLRFSPGDAESIVRAHEVLDAHLRSHDLGSLAYWYPEGERVDAVLRQATDGFHQIGTTRMADGPESGVTDSYGRVFGTRNLFVCSSSLFPTSGQANPTLTLLAYAIRQAEYLSRILGR